MRFCDAISRGIGDLKRLKEQQQQHADDTDNDFAYPTLERSTVSSTYNPSSNKYNTTRSCENYGNSRGLYASGSVLRDGRGGNAPSTMSARYSSMEYSPHSKIVIRGDKFRSPPLTSLYREEVLLRLLEHTVPQEEKQSSSSIHIDDPRHHKASSDVSSSSSSSSSSYASSYAALSAIPKSFLISSISDITALSAANFTPAQFSPLRSRDSLASPQRYV